MTTTDTAQHEVRCLRPGCSRKLTSAKSIEAGFGPVCLRKIRRAAEDKILATASPKVAEKARILIADKGIVPTNRPGVYQAMSLDGTRVYRVTARACTCEAGARAKYDCNHQLGARILDLAAIPPAVLAAPRRVFALGQPQYAKAA